MSALVHSLLPILALQLLLLLAALFVHIQSPGRGVVKLLVVPLALFCAMASPALFARLMGHSVSLPLPEKFTLIAYRPVVNAGVKTDLEIWMRVEGSTRLLRAPYSKGLEQALSQGASATQSGGEARIARKGKGKPGASRGTTTDDTAAEWEFSFQAPSELAKDGPPATAAAPPPPRDAQPDTKKYSI